MRRQGLGPIVAVLGGDLYDGGQRANVPGPGHPPSDRSLSLLLDGGRVVAHSFAGDDWRVALAGLEARGLIDRHARLSGAEFVAGSAAPKSRAMPAERIRVARAFWDQGQGLTASSAAARYLRWRGIDADLNALCDLRAHPAAPISAYGPARDRAPACWPPCARRAVSSRPLRSPI